MLVTDGRSQVNTWYGSKPSVAVARRVCWDAHNMEPVLLRVATFTRLSMGSERFTLSTLPPLPPTHTLGPDVEVEYALSVVQQRLRMVDPVQRAGVTGDPSDAVSSMKGRRSQKRRGDTPRSFTVG
jgi:hypothetical protein